MPAGRCSRHLIVGVAGAAAWVAHTFAATDIAVSAANVRGRRDLNGQLSLGGRLASSRTRRLSRSRSSPAWRCSAVAEPWRVQPTGGPPRTPALRLRGVDGPWRVGPGVPVALHAAGAAVRARRCIERRWCLQPCLATLASPGVVRAVGHCRCGDSRSSSSAGLRSLQSLAFRKPERADIGGAGPRSVQFSHAIRRCPGLQRRDGVPLSCRALRLLAAAAARHRQPVRRPGSRRAAVDLRRRPRSGQRRRAPRRDRRGSAVRSPS